MKKISIAATASVENDFDKMLLMRAIADLVQLHTGSSEIVVDLDDVAERQLDQCPECHQMTVRAKELSEGGGIECTNPDCGYWFCY